MDLTGLIRELQAVKAQARREDLFSGAGALGGDGFGAAGAGASFGDEDRETREVIRRGDDVLAQTEETLRDTQRLVNNSQDVGVNVMADLQDQREVLLGAQERVRETNAFTGEARVVLKRMAMRALYNKLVLYGIIVALLAAIGLVLWVKFIKR